LGQAALKCLLPVFVQEPAPDIAEARSTARHAWFNYRASAIQKRLEMSTSRSDVATSLS
jgi:hypothetical protein